MYGKDVWVNAKAMRAQANRRRVHMTINVQTERIPRD
jgi:hypothetical protein